MPAVIIVPIAPIAVHEDLSLRIARARAISVLNVYNRGRAGCAHRYTRTDGVQPREIWPTPAEVSR